MSVYVIILIFTLLSLFVDGPGSPASCSYQQWQGYCLDIVSGQQQKKHLPMLSSMVSQCCCFPHTVTVMLVCINKLLSVSADNNEHFRPMR